MPNYRAIIRTRPAYEQYLPLQRLVHRGEVVFFPGNLSVPAFSTDARGFRHTAFGEETLSVSDIVKRERYGLVLGTSKVFGIGLAGNKDTMSSLLSERFGFPFANVALPHGTSRNLSALLTAFLGRAANAPAAVVHSSNGDFSAFAYGSSADPVFGPPNIIQSRKMAMQPGALPDAERSVQAVLAFTSLWTGWIVQQCRARKTPLLLLHDSSFFEKRAPSPVELECGLGTSEHPVEQRWFANHKRFVDQFYDRRERLAERMKVPLAGPGKRNDLTFIDEFHLDEIGTRSLADDIAEGLEPLLK